MIDTHGEKSVALARRDCWPKGERKRGTKGWMVAGCGMMKALLVLGKCICAVVTSESMSSDVQQIWGFNLIL